VSEADASSRWDTFAIQQGASVVAMFVVPCTLIARFAFDQDSSSGWASILALGSFLGFVIGGGVAAWRQERDTPLSHALVTSIGVFLVIQFFFTIARVLMHDDIRWGRIIVSLTLASAGGLLGGFLGAFLQRKGVTPYR
jgi:predicted permease